MSAPVKKCEVCLGTGEVRGEGFLDCTSCDVAEQRAELEAWAEKHCADKVPSWDLWLIYQHGLAAAPVVPVAAQPVVQQEPVAYLRFRAAQQWSGMGGHDIEYAEWLETCQAHEIGDDKLPAFPVYAAPSLEAQPAGEVVNIPDMNDWDVQMACVKALLSATDGELGCIGSKLLDTYIEDVKRVVSAAMAQGEKHDN